MGHTKQQYYFCTRKLQCAGIINCGRLVTTLVTLRPPSRVPCPSTSKDSLQGRNPASIHCRARNANSRSIYIYANKNKHLTCCSFNDRSTALPFPEPIMWGACMHLLA